MQQPPDRDLEMAPAHCCPAMAAQINQVCPVHPNLVECPDAVVIMSGSGRYQFPIRDGGSSSMVATFCPWCGSRLVNATNPLSAKQWRAEAAVLAEIGVVIYDKNVSLEIELPEELVTLAVKAWELEEADDGIADFETATERIERHRAGSLALIGLTVTEHGEQTEGGVTVKLDPMLIGHALDAADDAGLIVGPPKGDGANGC